MAKIKEYFKNPLSTGISVGYLLSAVSVLYYLVSFVIVFVRLDGAGICDEFCLVSVILHGERI